MTESRKDRWARLRGSLAEMRWLPARLPCGWSIMVIVCGQRRRCAVQSVGRASMDVNASEPRTETDDRTTDTLELFFDLVFVFAMSQVTHLMLTEGSWLGLGRGALALTAVWWA